MLYKYNLGTLLELIVLKQTAFEIDITDPVSVSSTIDLNSYANWIWHNIYSTLHSPLATRHGSNTVVRVAMYARIWANLYRRYNDQDALLLSEEKIKLIQIALLFYRRLIHDLKVDGQKKCASLFYFYATKILNADPIIIQEIAEALVNVHSIKESTTYYQIINVDNDTISWQKFTTDTHPPKSIIFKIIADTILLDTIRSKITFNSEQLYFYTDVANSDEDALQILAHITDEARSLIAHDGDSYYLSDSKSKSTHVELDKYAVVLQNVSSGFYPIFKKLYGEEQLLSYEALQTLDLSKDNPLNRNILMRAIVEPAVILEQKSESRAELEFRKVNRTPGVPTKSGRLNVQGNYDRSFSMMGHGAGVYGPVGIILFNPDLTRISKISLVNMASGYEKKSEPTSRVSDKFIVTYEEIIRQSKLGWKAYKDQRGQVRTHNEVLYHFQAIDMNENAAGFFYTTEPTPKTLSTHDAPILNEIVIQLQVIYLQRKYLQAYGKLLKIWQYSREHNRLEERNFSDEQIITMWSLLNSNFFSKWKPEQEMLGSLAEINMDCVVALAQVRGSKREVLYSPYSQDLRDQIEHQTYKIYMANKCDKICLDSLERNFTLSLMKSYDTAVQLLSDQDLIHIRHLMLQKLKFLLDSIDTDLTHKRVSFKLPHILANLALISTKFDLVDNLTELYSKIDCMKLHEITVPVDSIRWLKINEKVTALASYVKDHGLFDMQHVNVVIFRLRYQDTTFTEYFVLNFFTDKRWLQPLLEIIPPTQTNDFLLIEKTRPYNSSQMVGWLNKIFAGRDSTLEMEQPVERRTWTIRT